MKLSVVASYDPREWWYGHLCRALALEAEMRSFPGFTEVSPGYSWETPLADLIGGDFEDGVYLGSVNAVHPDLWNLPSLTTTWTDYLPELGYQEEILKMYDVLFATCYEGVGQWKALGVEEVYYLPFAFDDLLPANAPLEEKVELAFVGATNLPIHALRRRYLPELMRRFRMNDFQRRYSQSETAGIYASAKIVVNITELVGFNMRNFEAMGMGAMLLTPNTGYGVPQLFQDGVHLVVYDGIEDLLEKASYYLAHDEERTKIAEAGRKEVLSKHTYRHRAREFLRVTGEARERRGIARKRATPAMAYANFYRHHRRLDKLAEVLCGRGLTLGHRVRVVRQMAACLASLCRSGSKLSLPQWQP